MPDPTTLDDRVDEFEEDAEPRYLVRAATSPSVPVNIDDLAAMRGEAIEVLEARLLILETARKRAIRLTHPEDWVLFKSPDERVTGYLQDCGCERARDVIGVEVFHVSAVERIPSADGQSFMCIVSGDGRSRLTLQTVEHMEGGRSSTDDFCKDKTGAQLELLVRKAARANLDGNIARELMGLKSVPLAEIVAAWTGTAKDWQHCRKGRGFGTGVERAGGANEKEPEVSPPKCGQCGATAVFRSNARGGFYGCPDWKKHEQKKWSVDAAKWAAEQGPRDAKERADIEDAKRQDAELANGAKP